MSAPTFPPDASIAKITIKKIIQRIDDFSYGGFLCYPISGDDDVVAAFALFGLRHITSVDYDQWTEHATSQALPVIEAALERAQQPYTTESEIWNFAMSKCQDDPFRWLGVKSRCLALVADRIMYYRALYRKRQLQPGTYQRFLEALDRWALIPLNVVKKTPNGKTLLVRLEGHTKATMDAESIPTSSSRTQSLLPPSEHPCGSLEINDSSDLESSNLSKKNRMNTECDIASMASDNEDLHSVTEPSGPASEIESIYALRIENLKLLQLAAEKDLANAKSSLDQERLWIGIQRLINPARLAQGQPVWRPDDIREYLESCEPALNTEQEN